MTRISYEDKEFYYDAMEDKVGGRARHVAATTTSVMDAVLKAFRDEGLKFPNDDRCFAVEIAIFKAAMEANQA